MSFVFVIPYHLQVWGAGLWCKGEGRGAAVQEQVAAANMDGRCQRKEKGREKRKEQKMKRQDKGIHTH